jgi:hypothetical protein
MPRILNTALTGKVGRRATVQGWVHRARLITDHRDVLAGMVAEIRASASAEVELAVRICPTYPRRFRSRRTAVSPSDWNAGPRAWSRPTTSGAQH